MSQRATRVAALYDIHGNLPALEAVLAEVEREGVDLIVVGGDVLPGPMPRASLSRLTSLDTPVRFIRGNGEREVLALLDGAASTTLPEPVLEVLRWVAGELSADEVELLRSWPETARVPVSETADALFCHATPRSDTEIFTRMTADAALEPMFAGVDAPLVVCGHTHMPFDRTIGDVRIVNAGSVGMPFGKPGAYWLLLDPGVRPRRTLYDLEAAAAEVRDTAYPQAESFAERQILRPPSEEEALAALEGSPPPRS